MLCLSYLLVSGIRLCAYPHGISYFLGIAIYHSNSRPYSEFSSHIYSRSTPAMSSGRFLRDATLVIILSSAQGLYLLFLIVTAPPYVPSTGWSRDLSKIIILHSDLDSESVTNTKLAAWYAPAISGFYVVCALLLGQEGREIFRFLRDSPRKITRWSQEVRRPRCSSKVLSTIPMQ